MPYQAVPNSGQSLGQTRDQIRNNIAALKTSLAVNHVDLDLANTGKHKYVVMPITTPTLPGAASEGVIYTKAGPNGTDIYYSADNGNKEYQITRVKDSSFTKFGTSSALPSANGNGGWTFLPGGLLLQYGSFNPNTSTTVQFPISFTSTPFSVTLTGSADNNSTFRAGVSTGTLTNTQFIFEGSISSHWNPIYFVAIGA